MGNARVLDTLDRRIAAALQLNGRMSWRDIAEAVGSTETTVSRRAQRMIDAGVARITLSRTPACFGQSYVVTVFLRCAPGSQIGVARHLAARPDVWFTGIFAGSADVICQVTVPTGDALALVLLGELQRIPGVVSSSAEAVTRTFKLSYAWARELLDDRADALAVDHVAHQSEGHSLSAEDEAIIGCLQANARMPFAVAGQRLGMHESTVRRRFEALLREGCVNVATFVNSAAMGFQPPLIMKIAVEPGRIEKVANELARYPMVRYLAATLGTVGLLAEVTLARRADIHEFNTRILGGLRGVSGVEVWQELIGVKRAYVMLDDPTGLTHTPPEDPAAVPVVG